MPIETVKQIQANSIIEYLQAMSHEEDVVGFENKDNLLQITINNNNINMLNTLLRRGADPNFWHYRNGSTLQTAIAEDNLVAVQLLLSYGSNPNAADYFGETPLRSALNNTHAKLQPVIIQSLLRYGAEAR
ncbi:MAG: ankyrin repeat domain-containing protein [Fibrella sp.]|nr:ankyrin repeat domain-containing protein [Armatimonadota bacterium]